MRKSTLARSLVNLLMSIYKEEKKNLFSELRKRMKLCNIFGSFFSLVFTEMAKEILHYYEIFIIYPDISLMHFKKKKLGYYLNLNMHTICNHDSPCSQRAKNWVRYTTPKLLGIVLRGSMKVNTQVLCSQLLLILVTSM